MRIFTRNNASDSEKAEVVTAWGLAWRKFKRHKLAITAMAILAFVYVMVIFAGFFAPYLPAETLPHIHMPPQRIHFFDHQGKLHLMPFMYGMKSEMDLEKLQRVYIEDKTVYIRFASSLGARRRSTVRIETSRGSGCLAWMMVVRLHF
jgi:peptide/nickel transport system permease protein